jgi:hypothetical protein
MAMEEVQVAFPGASFAGRQKRHVETRRGGPQIVFPRNSGDSIFATRAIRIAPANGTMPRSGTERRQFEGVAMAWSWLSERGGLAIRQ